MFPRLNQKMWDFLNRARQWLQMAWDRLLGRAASSTLAPSPGTPLTSVCEEEMVTWTQPLRPKRITAVPGWNPRWQEEEDERRERETLLMRMYD